MTGSQILDFIIQTVTSAVVAMGGAASLVWLTKAAISERLKNSIKYEYDQKLQTHKAQLEAQSALEIEKLRSQLSVTAAQQNVIFSRLHEQRASVIADTYALLKVLYSAVAKHTSIVECPGWPPKEERRKEAVKAFEAFQGNLTKLIFLPKITAQKIDDISKDITKAYNVFFMAVETPGNPSRTKTWMDISDMVEGNI